MNKCSFYIPFCSIILSEFKREVDKLEKNLSEKGIEIQKKGLCISAAKNMTIA